MHQPRRLHRLHDTVRRTDFRLPTQRTKKCEIQSFQRFDGFRGRSRHTFPIASVPQRSVGPSAQKSHRFRPKTKRRLDLIFISPFVCFFFLQIFHFRRTRDEVDLFRFTVRSGSSARRRSDFRSAIERRRLIGSFIIGIGDRSPFATFTVGLVTSTNAT